MKWIGCLCLLVLCMVLGGCQSDEETALSGKTGLLITLTDEEHHAYSRTAPSELEDPVTEKFQLKVVYSGRISQLIKAVVRNSSCWRKVRTI